MSVKSKTGGKSKKGKRKWLKHAGNGRSILYRVIRKDLFVVR